MSRIAVIGAGKTGRGFVGRLLAEAGETITYIDKNETLVSKMNAAAESGEGFSVYFYGDVREPMKITGYRAVTWADAELSDAEYIFVSVGGSNLQAVGAALKEKLPADREICVITCENASDPAGILAAAIDMPNVYVSQSTVFCTTIERNGREDLHINSENYPYLQYDADRLGGRTPGIDPIRPIENFGNFLTRKLFTYNAASGVIAYMGYLYGYTDYSQAANSPLIQNLLDQNYAVTNAVLCAAFGYDKADQEEFAKLSREKFTSRTIVDTVERNAREPQRKLGPKERIIGPMKLIHTYGVRPTVLMMTAAAALLYDGDEEIAWRKIKKENTPEEILRTIGGLTDDEQELIDGILSYYEEYKAALEPEL